MVRNRQLETDKSQLIVEHTRQLLKDVQIKCNMMEKEISRGEINSSWQKDAAFKQLNDRNNELLQMIEKLEMEKNRMGTKVKKMQEISDNSLKCMFQMQKRFRSDRKQNRTHTIRIY